jgi:phenylacetate-CoA ligase
MKKAAWVRAIQEQVKRLSESPFYLKRFRAIGLSPGDIGSLEDFQKIPLMDTKDLQEDLEEHAPHGSLFHSGTVRVTLSPGPKGLMPVYHTRQDVEEVNRELAAMYRACGVGSHDIAAITFGYHLFIAGITIRV